MVPRRHPLADLGAHEPDVGRVHVVEPVSADLEGVAGEVAPGYVRREPLELDPRVQFSGSPEMGFGHGQGKMYPPGGRTSSAFQPTHPAWLYCVENVSFLQTWVRWKGGWNSSPR